MTTSARIALVSLLLAGSLMFATGASARPVPAPPRAPLPQSSAPQQTAAAPEHETVPRLLQFSGTLKDSAARPLAGPASVTFALYAEQDGGTPLWSETQNVLADTNGHYSVLLGAATIAGMPAELFGTGQSRWLGVTVARHEEMPRVLLASVPYALKAADAETLGGLPASAYVTNESLAARIGAAPPSTTILSTPQASTPANSAQFATANGAAAATASAAVPNAVPSGGGLTNYIPLWTSSETLSDSLLYQNGGNIGIGTTTPTETLDVNGNSIFRGSFQLPPGHPAIASSGYESHSFQFQASSFNSTTGTSNTEAFGFRAEPLNNNTPNPSAKLDLFFGAGGSAPFTDTGLSFAANGIMTFAPGQIFNGVAENLTGALNLPQTTNSSNGVITLGGLPEINNFGDPSNIFVGPNSGGAFTTSNAGSRGNYNSAFGGKSLYLNTSGYQNTALGFEALYSNTSGYYNTGVGLFALDDNTTGFGNTAIGDGAGIPISTGSYNTFVGLNAGVPSGAGALTNATAIGAGSVVGASNSMVLGVVQGVAGNQFSTHVGIGTTTPNYTLEVHDDGISSLDGAAIVGGSNYPNNFGVYGFSTATTGNSNGGYFYSSSPNGSGVVGTNNAGGYGGYFYSSTGAGAAIVGATQGSSGLAGQFLGNVSVSGTLTKGAGSFKIDDPIDPGGKYLSHSFVESPDMKNIYDGTVVTNAKGYAIVTMPPWFEALNSDFRYQLTPVGQFSQAMIASEIKDRKFVIRTSKPHVKISWQVTGIRHDAYANAHRIPTEEVKPASEQGHYLHPELFGAGPEQGIGNAAMAANAPTAHKDH
jgi:trimeric autotransporter adhesin